MAGDTHDVGILPQCHHDIIVIVVTVVTPMLNVSAYAVLMTMRG